MSMYNMIHGEDPYATVYLSVLGLRRQDIPRYRDCFWDGETIGVHTRTGGGNRDLYQCTTEGPSIDSIQAHPCYIRDEDSKKDSTYMTFYFKVPSEMAWVIPHMKATDLSPDEKWNSFFQKMNDVDAASDPQVQKALAAFSPLMEKLATHFKK